MSKGIFVTATGTDVGKTFVSALIVKKMREYGLNIGYYKAALSGAEKIDGKLIAGDAKYVSDICDLEYGVDTIVSYVYKCHVSPHLAARLEGNPVKLDIVQRDFEIAKSRFDYICAEGCGGIICPIYIDEYQTILLEDIIKKIGLSVIVVAQSGLGTINSTFLTIQYIRLKGIEIKGIILNNFDETNYMHVDNKHQIEYLCDVPVIACVKENDTDLDISYEDLAAIFKEV